MDRRQSRQSANPRRPKGAAIWTIAENLIVVHGLFHLHKGAAIWTIAENLNAVP